jgi:hypothetical protein
MKTKLAAILVTALLCAAPFVFGQDNSGSNASTTEKKSTGTEMKDATKTAAKDTKKGVKTAAKDTAKGTKTAAKDTEKGTKTAAKDTGKAAQKTGSAVKKGVKKVAGKKDDKTATTPADTPK